MVLLSFGSRALGEQPNGFSISIDERMRDKWGFEYPVTYVFQVSDISRQTTVLRRDADSEAWRPLERKTSEDFFNGVECVRFDPAGGKAHVSVGFATTERIQLKFRDAGSVTFDQVARYYDARKAAFTLSLDNWGRKNTANAGAPWRGMTDDASDKYQASVHACRVFHLPVSVGVNTRSYGGRAIWERMQEELDRGDYSWEPAVHTRRHPCSEKAYLAGGYTDEIVGCRDDILEGLDKIPYGQYVFEFILPCAYKDDAVRRAAAGEFLFARDWNVHDNPASTDYVPWNSKYEYYGIGGAADEILRCDNGGPPSKGTIPRRRRGRVERGLRHGVRAGRHLLRHVACRPVREQRALRSSTGLGRRGRLDADAAFHPRGQSARRLVRGQRLALLLPLRCRACEGELRCSVMRGGWSGD